MPAPEQARVEAEHGNDVIALGGGRERGVVGEPQVAAVPDQGDAHIARPSTSRSAPSSSGCVNMNPTSVSRLGMAR